MKCCNREGCMDEEKDCERISGDVTGCFDDLGRNRAISKARLYISSTLVCR